MKSELCVVKGLPSWILRSDRVELAVTEMGGHLAPVTFDRESRRPIQPFYVSPFCKIRGLKAPNVIKALRGDFFCLPFGSNKDSYHGEQHPLHGETANGRWKYVRHHVDKKMHSLELELQLRVRAGRVRKKIMVRDGEDVVYQEHVIRGMRGPNCPAHHPTLECPSEGRIAVSPFLWGSTYDRMMGVPEEGNYCGLKPGFIFRKLGRAPLVYGGDTDLSVYPNRKGFEDVIQIMADPRRKLAWNTVTFAKAGWLYFALRNPQELRQTTFWFLNGGRWGSPVNGKGNVLGIEDSTGYLADGLARSAKSNPWTRRGVSTTMAFHPDRPNVIRYILGVARIPRGFEVVRDVDFKPHQVIFKGNHGKVEARVDWKFVTDPVLKDDKCTFMSL